LPIREYSSLEIPSGFLVTVGWRRSWEGPAADAVAGSGRDNILRTSAAEAAIITEMWLAQERKEQPAGTL
jgi:hypothetical protein